VDEEQSASRLYARALLAALQMLALALCALVLANMLAEEKLRIPYRACVQAPDYVPPVDSE
jgi:hypothetical protein